MLSVSYPTRNQNQSSNGSQGSGKNVLVTGGAGYIGSALLPMLLNHGYHVRVLDLLVFGTRPLAAVLGHPNLEIVRGDFLQTAHLAEAMEGMDAIVHMGAIVGDPACAQDQGLAAGVNLLATNSLTTLAKQRKIERLIFTSTCSVYGASDEILNEESDLNPVSLYARSKIASEHILRRTSNATILRFGTIFGISGRTRFDLVVNLLAAKAVIDGKITVFGGDQWRPFVHVEDAAMSILLALQAPLDCVASETFNVGSNEQNYTIGQVGEIVHNAVPTAEMISSGTDSDRRNYRVSFDKIACTLGFQPKWTVEQGVAQVVERIISGEVADYRAARHSNHKSTKLLYMIHGFPGYMLPSAGGRPGVNHHGEIWNTQTARSWQRTLSR